MNRQVDHTALKVNQASIIAFLGLAFLLNQVWLVTLVSAVMLVGTLWPRAGLFKLFYARVLKPAGILHPNVIPDDPQPHLFAQGLGGIMLAAAIVAFALGAAVLGWLLVWVVAVLAAVNLFFHFCLGCFIYYHLARHGIRPDLPAWRSA